MNCWRVTHCRRFFSFLLRSLDTSNCFLGSSLSFAVRRSCGSAKPSRHHIFGTISSAVVASAWYCLFMADGGGGDGGISLFVGTDRFLLHLFAPSRHPAFLIADESVGRYQAPLSTAQAIEDTEWLTSRNTQSSSDEVEGRNINNARHQRLSRQLYRWQRMIRDDVSESLEAETKSSSLYLQN